jgi:SMODS-associated and fused to various effectors sensor domain
MDVERRGISRCLLAPIPVLVLLGSCLSNKIPVDLYQRHRSGKHPWKWREDGTPASYTVNVVRRAIDPTKVGLTLPLSGKIDTLSIPLDADYCLYEIRLANAVPNVGATLRSSDRHTDGSWESS